MITNIYYLFGCIILIYNLFLVSKYREAITSVEWLTLYRSKRRQPDKGRVNFKLVNLWILSSLASSVWLFCGIFTESYLLFMFLFIVNIITNYFLSKNSGTVKMKLSFIKSIVYNFILFTLILAYLVSCSFHQ